jgi:short-subunit dehydrogenase
MGTPDIVINSAGIGRWLFAEETSPAEAVRMMAAPYFAAFYITRAFLPDMLKRHSGHVVNINSPASRVPWPGSTAYAAARWAMKGFTEALRADFWRTGLRVTSIVAGKVDTPYFIHNPGTVERSPTIARLIPTLTPEQVAGSIVRAIEHNQREVVIPFMLRVFYAAHSVLPRLVERIVCSTGWQHPPA